jgi:hypothetical protein
MENARQLIAVDSSREKRDPVSDFCAGLLVPGLGQWLQGRRSTGVYFLLEFTSLAIVALAFPAYATAAWIAASVVLLFSAGEAARAATR